VRRFILLAAFMGATIEFGVAGVVIALGSSRWAVLPPATLAVFAGIASICLLIRDAERQERV
jgi:hypothetical protein